MRIDELIIALQKRRVDLEKQAYSTPPQNQEEFSKRLGVWMGLGEALSVIEDARKKEQDD